jgi:formate/nitrite transporter FocA (FNT family)
MVWLLPGAESARVSIIIIVIYLVGIGGFNHIVAGSTTIFFLVVTRLLSWGAYVTRFFIPTLLGNVIGGTALVAALGHAQVVRAKPASGNKGKTVKAKEDSLRAPAIATGRGSGSATGKRTRV